MSQLRSTFDRLMPVNNKPTFVQLQAMEKSKYIEFIALTVSFSFSIFDPLPTQSFTLLQIKVKYYFPHFNLHLLNFILLK